MLFLAQIPDEWDVCKRELHLRSVSTNPSVSFGRTSDYQTFSFGESEEYEIVYQPSRLLIDQDSKMVRSEIDQVCMSSVTDPTARKPGDWVHTILPGKVR